MYKIVFKCENKTEGYKTGKVISCKKFDNDDLDDFKKRQIIIYGYHLRTDNKNDTLEISGYIDIKKVKETLDTDTTLPLIHMFYNHIKKMLREEKLERICNG